MKRVETATGDFKKLAELVRGTQFLEHIKVGKLQKVCRSVALYQFDTDETIFKQNQRADNFYIIYKGTVRVTLNKTLFNKGLDVATLHQGNFFGEAALLYNTTRSAACICQTPVQAFVFSSDDFQILCQSNYKFRQVLKQVAVERLLDTQKNLKEWDPKAAGRLKKEKLLKQKADAARTSAKAPQQKSRKDFITKLIERKIFFEVEVRSSFMRVRLGPKFSELQEQQKHSFLSVALAYAKEIDGKGDELVLFDFKTGRKIGYYATNDLQIKVIGPPKKGTKKNALAPDG